MRFALVMLTALLLGFFVWNRGNLGVLQLCHTHGALQDSICTPGMANPDVTQANLAQTICNPNWRTGSIRPSTNYTNKLKNEQMKLYGLTGSVSDYEEDHLVPLTDGGHPTDPRNLWPERWDGAEGAHSKDRIENIVHREICDGTITLERGQEIFKKGEWLKCIGQDRCL